MTNSAIKRACGKQVTRNQVQPNRLNSDNWASRHVNVCSHASYFRGYLAQNPSSLQKESGTFGLLGGAVNELGQLVPLGDLSWQSERITTYPLTIEASALHIHWLTMPQRLAFFAQHGGMCTPGSSHRQLIARTSGNATPHLPASSLSAAQRATRFWFNMVQLDPAFPRRQHEPALQCQ